MGTEKRPLKFIHCNIWNGGRLLENLVPFLISESPDILAIQEAYDGHDALLERRFCSMDVLGAALGLRHRAFAATHNDVFPNFTVPNGNAVLSRYPIMREEVLFFDLPFKERRMDDERDFTKMPCNLQHVVLDVKGTHLHVFNTHGIWDTHGQDNPRRLAMVETINTNIRDKRPAVLCGDFNVNEGTTSIGNLDRHLVNVFAPDRRVTSFNVGRKAKGTGYATAVVDFIFVSDGVTVTGHRQPAVDVSDHLPLICEFKI
ncbi:MAG: endonuclease/exonuclease/phosphatase family protein [Patescibacteria group bacterium]|nr:endonuclease/exonuclease/phosphatase family protein [Patescibacteria group bacterium]